MSTNKDEVDDSEDQGVDVDNVHGSEDGTSTLGIWSRQDTCRNGEEESSQGTSDGERRERFRRLIQFNYCTQPSYDMAWIASLDAPSTLNFAASP